MNLEHRIDLLTELGSYCLSKEPAWLTARSCAQAENGWFIPEFMDAAIRQIAGQFLQKESLLNWARAYGIAETTPDPSTVGLVMAGNIPLVGFHDFLSIFISGHRQQIKPSSRDQALITQLVERLVGYDREVSSLVSLPTRLQDCDAYIATGSNNSGRYFDYYFGKHPHIIRRNRTSVAILDGRETSEELAALAADICMYFGLGCRNVTKVYVPEGYDFIPLLDAFSAWHHLMDFPKYKHNYDYQLTLLILNKKYYITDKLVLLTENESPFSPISVLHYAYHRPGEGTLAALADDPNVQCIVGHGKSSPGLVPFGRAQYPTLTDYADGVDTLDFLRKL
jgi:hypothetical protein